MNQRKKNWPLPIWLRWGLGGLLVGIATVWGSFYTFSDAAWLSGILGNLGVTILLIVPAAYVGHRFADWIGEVNLRTNRAVTDASIAKDDAASAQSKIHTLTNAVASDLQSLREQLIADQVAESEKEHANFSALRERGDYDTIVAALRAGLESGLISEEGVRTPVWETNLHIRFVPPNENDLVGVNLEWDDGTIVATHGWSVEMKPLALFRDLWRSVQKAGEYLGVGLFDPTESLERLSEALEYASRYRAQKLRSGSEYFRDVVEFVDGWYITNHGMFAKNHEYYFISVGRLWEMDWESHISGKRWDDENIVTAIAVARALHADKKPVPL